MWVSSARGHSRRDSHDVTASSGLPLASIDKRCPICISGMVRTKMTGSEDIANRR